MAVFLKNQIKPLLVIAVIFSIFNLYGDDKTDAKTSATVSGKYALSVKKQIKSEITTDSLKFVKGKKGKLVELVYASTVLEEKGTPNEKVCICMANAFRAAQIASNVWSDGIFRTEDIKEIKTGWNTEGPFEMFEEVMGISEEKIIITGRNGKKPTDGKDLTINDLWYEFTFINGEKLFIEADFSNRALSDKFLELRRKFKNGDESVKKDMGAERKITVSNMAILPFKNLIIKK